ncbi:MAG: hypothetical protein DMG40_04100 [Acidobacteria bacterium]|nr:MAG: hypothetical protein DMG40_04100 [Acidobacteriota bacterium]
MAKKQKSAKRGVKKVTTKAKLSRKKAPPKRKGMHKSSRKPAARRRPVRQTQVVMGSQSVETVPLKRRARTAAAGAGVSVVEGVDSESADELLEEGQTFEAGIVSGVEDAPDADQGEVRTHEVPQDDVPEEYEDKDRP